MSQPTPYTRLFSFTDWSTQHPSSPQPGIDLDGEYNRIKLTTDQVLANLALIQRDDGALKNASVSPDTLSIATKALISGWTPRGPWAALTAYAVKDLVQNAGISYVCWNAHTSAGAFATTNWVIVGTDSTFQASGAGAIVRTASQKLADYAIDVKDYGAVGDGVTDDLAAINLAIAALPTQGGAVYFPATTNGYLISGQISIPSNRSRYRIFGDGFGSRIVKSANDALPMLTWASAGANVVSSHNCIISDLCFDANGKTGDCVRIENAQLVKIHRCFALNFATTYSGFYLTGGGTTASSSNELHDLYIDNISGGYAGIRVTAKAVDVLIDGVFQNGNFVTKYCIALENSGTIQICNVHVYNVTDNIVNIQGGVGNYTFTNCVFDNAQKDIAFIDGSANTVNGVIFVGCRFMSLADGFSGALLKTATGVQFLGCTFTISATKRYAVEETVSSDYTLIVGGRAEGTPQFASAILLIGSHSRALGLGPQIWSVGQSLCGSTIGTVAAASTVFLGSNAQQASENDSMMMAPRAGSIVAVRIETVAAPGVGKNFTYTVRVNQVDTAMTGQISGSGSFLVDLTGGPIAVSANNRISIKLVTDAAATASQHRWSMRIDS